MHRDLKTNHAISSNTKAGGKQTVIGEIEISSNPRSIGRMNFDKQNKSFSAECSKHIQKYLLMQEVAWKDNGK